jgi:hypothetical protein
MQALVEINRFSREEKLKIMEAIWEDLSKEDGQVESPDWHHEALQTTNARFLSGQENSVDWQEAKRDLRKRFE